MTTKQDKTLEQLKAEMDAACHEWHRADGKLRGGTLMMSEVRLSAVTARMRACAAAYARRGR